MRKALVHTLMLVAFSGAFLPLATADSKSTSDESVAKAIVLLDTSGSMKGEKLEAAKSLLIERVSHARADLDIYTFAQSISRISTLDKSAAEISAAINAIEAGSRTSLYDSLFQIVPSAQQSHSPIIVLSDGEDSQSATTLSQLLELLTPQQVPVSFLKAFIDPTFLDSTTQISQISGGMILDQFPTLPKEAPLFPEGNGDSRWAQLLGAGYALAIALIGYRVREVQAARKRLMRNKEVLAESESSSASQNSASSNSFIRQVRGFLGLADDYLDPRVKQILIVISILVFGLFLLAFRNIFVSLAMTILILFMSLRVRVNTQASRRRASFEKELPGALKMLAGSLTAGLSFLQALHAYAEDGKGVSSQEFRRALSEIQLGVPIERALESIADRMKSEDLKWAVSAFAIQREVGGSLATILSSTAETLETRFDLRREVQTLSAEGRISSYILMALPVVIFIFLFLLRPAYVSIFITEPIGNFLLVLIGIGLALAWFWMKSLVRISI